MLADVIFALPSLIGDPGFIKTISVGGSSVQPAMYTNHISAEQRLHDIMQLSDQEKLSVLQVLWPARGYE